MEGRRERQLQRREREERATRSVGGAKKLKNEKTIAGSTSRCVLTSDEDGESARLLPLSTLSFGNTIYLFVGSWMTMALVIRDALFTLATRSSLLSSLQIDFFIKYLSQLMFKKF